LSLPDYEPMLATPWPAPFDDDGWWFEVKWDGYRAIVGNDGGRIRARSRRGLDLLDRFPELRSAPIPEGVVVDAEVIAFDDQGVPSFSLLQSGTPTNLVVFDLLYRDEDLTSRPYEQRRVALEGLALPGPILVPEPTRREGRALFQAVAGKGLEGIVGKRSGSRYQPGRRSPDWRKVAVRHRLRAVVGGYLPGEGSRAATFGSLLVGLNDDQGLRWIGAVGSGFDQRTLGAIHDALRRLERPTSPFSGPVTLPGPKEWVEPSIVIAVEYKEMTRDGRLRAPVFKGVEAADPETVTWAEETPV
jgi:bifunctional non-homologous end joining protein LigD